MNRSMYRDTGSDLAEDREEAGSDLVEPLVEVQNALSREEVPLDVLTPKQAEAMRRLGELAKLPENWDGYGSLPPTQIAIELVMDLLLNIDDRHLPAARVVPVSDGGVQLEWRTADRELHLEVAGDGTGQYLQMQDGQPQKEDEVTPRIDYVRPLLAWLSPRTVERLAA